MMTCDVGISEHDKSFQSPKGAADQISSMADLADHGTSTGLKHTIR